MSKLVLIPTKQQSHILAIVQSQRLSLFGHIARMPDKVDARRILTASLPDDWRRPLGRPHVTWFKTILQQGLKSDNLSLNKAIDMAQNRPLCRDCCPCLALRTPSRACQKRSGNSGVGINRPLTELSFQCLNVRRFLLQLRLKQSIFSQFTVEKRDTKKLPSSQQM